MKFKSRPDCDPLLPATNKFDAEIGAVSPAREPGGWRSIPYILGIEAFEKVASYGLIANLVLYLGERYGMGQVAAAKIGFIFDGTTNFTPLFGAFVADAYWGRFRTLAFGSVVKCLGLVLWTVASLVPQLQSPNCSVTAQQSGQCTGPTKLQLSFLYFTMGLMAVGAGGIRSCTLPFGVDQFDTATEHGKKSLNSFFNWFLNKAAIICESESSPDGSLANTWRLCSIQRIEEIKCLMQIMPIWACGVIPFLAMSQQCSFAVLQSLKMDRHLGPNFQIPAASVSSITMFASIVFIPIYGRILVPAMRGITEIDGGITLLQRQGVGMVISTLSLFLAAIVEKMRRDSALSNNGVSPISALWLVPQLVVLSIGDLFNSIGQVEFYNRQFPESMKTLAGSLLCLSQAGGSYMANLIVTIIQKTTRGDGRKNWLDDDINEGRLDYYYYLIAAMGVLNFLYFILRAKSYQYKGM